MAKVRNEKGNILGSKSHVKNFSFSFSVVTGEFWEDTEVIVILKYVCSIVLGFGVISLTLDVLVDLRLNVREDVWKTPSITKKNCYRNTLSTHVISNSSSPDISGKIERVLRMK